MKLQLLQYLSNLFLFILALTLQLLLHLSELSISPYQSLILPLNQKQPLFEFIYLTPVLFHLGFKVLYLALFVGFVFAELKVDVLLFDFR